ncbi:MAG: Dabb family protein [Mariprofundaceae bacterium]
MIIHSVMWRLCKDSKAVHAAKIKRDIDALVGVIPEIKTLMVAVNSVDSDHAADVVLYSTFDDWQALGRYQAHPEHQKVVEFVRSVVEERRVVDSEIP